MPPRRVALERPEGLPAARELGLYFPGLAFHSCRREVARRIQEAGASAVEAQLTSGTRVLR